MEYSAIRNFVPQQPYVTSPPVPTFNFISSTTPSSIPIGNFTPSHPHYSSLQNLMLMTPSSAEICQISSANYPRLQYYVHTPYQSSAVARFNSQFKVVRKEPIVPSPTTQTTPPSKPSSNFTIDALLNQEETTPDTTTVIKSVDETKATVYNWLYSSRYKPPKFNSKCQSINT